MRLIQAGPEALESRATLTRDAQQRVCDKLSARVVRCDDARKRAVKPRAHCHLHHLPVSELIRFCEQEFHAREAGPENEHLDLAPVLSMDNGLQTVIAIDRSQIRSTGAVAPARRIRKRNPQGRKIHVLQPESVETLCHSGECVTQLQQFCHQSLNLL